MKEYNPTYSLVKRIKSESDEASGIQLPICRITKKNREEHVELHHDYGVSKIQIVWNCEGTVFILQQIYCEEKKDESWNLCVKGVLKDMSV